MTSTKQDTKAALQIVMAVAEAIRELKRVPNGHLYAQLMGKMSLESYSSIITILKNTGLVEERFNELIWVGPVQLDKGEGQ